ncbi:hypothetical protein ACP70R_025073 [Stipagrostis hirtigluma subsp. patula]
MVGKRRRSGHPRGERPYRCDRTERIIGNRSALLRTINGFYAAALERLPVEELPSLVPRLLKAGLCVGFSDPVSNIVVNTISYSHRAPKRKPMASGGSDGKRAARRRRKALSRAVADTSDVKDWSPRRRLLRRMPVAARSLEALVAFLTYYFRYLPVCEALEYLRLAKADLLTAVRLIEEDRNSAGGFSFASVTTKTALKCSALAARHPKPRALVNRSFSLACQMEHMSRLLATNGGCLSCGAVETINGLLQRRRKLRSLAGIAPPQLPQEKNKPPVVATKSLRSILLDKIYELYLNAVALLPTADLRMCYHMGLLKAGHCYGPLKDPVSNIVLNTLWYKAMYPPQEGFSVAMICSRSLVRVTCRSLLGLVAYLRTCFSISEHQAMHYLLLSGANLWAAIEVARREGHPERTMYDQGSAYKAAAKAARHPDPNAVVRFFVSTFPRLPLPLQTEPFLLDVQLLSQMVQQYCFSACGSAQTVPVLSEDGTKFLKWIQRDFKKEERFIHAKVNGALQKYTRQTRGPEYELHVICGLNSNVVKSFVFGQRYGPGFRIRKTQYSHVNFLARPKDLHSEKFPTLFFAECSNDEDLINDSSCWPVTVNSGIGRCFYCENEGAKVVHPVWEKYHGRDIDFEEMACNDFGGMPVDDRGDRLIAESVDICEEDCIYFDASRDAKCAELLNARAVIFRQRCFV